MAGWGMTDQDIEKWGCWFRSYVERISTGRRNESLWAHEVNFAENQLTCAGVRCLLETLIECKVSVLVLKLHHNQLTTGTSVAEFIVNSEGSLRELHLSHNELETPAAAEIVLAAAAARDSHGAFCYPSHAGHSAAPLWLRLEQNYVDATTLSHRTDQEFEHMRPGKVLCNVSSRACTPHSCVKHRHEPPPVHAKHLSNQRGKTAHNNHGQDLLNMLQSGKREEDQRLGVDKPTPAWGEYGDRPAEKDGLDAKLAFCQGTIDTKDDADGREGLFADVLRWDDDELRWVRDVIEITEPKVTPPTAELNSRVVLSQEVGDKLGNALKHMIGGAKRPAVKEYVEPESPRRSPYVARTPSTPSTQAPEDGDVPGRWRANSRAAAVPQDEEHSSRSPASRRSRRGAQPFGSEESQVNGFTLNPQAPEFIPVAGIDAGFLAEAVRELNLQGYLDPEADLRALDMLTRSDSSSSSFNGIAATDADDPAPAAPDPVDAAPAAPSADDAAPAAPSADSAELEANSAATAIPPSELEAEAIDDAAAPTSPCHGAGQSGITEHNEDGVAQIVDDSDRTCKEECAEEDSWSIGKALFSAFSFVGLSSSKEPLST